MVFVLWIVMSTLYSIVLLRYKEAAAWLSGALGAILILLSGGEGILLNIGLFLAAPMLLVILLDYLLTYTVLPIYHFFRFIFRKRRHINRDQDLGGK